MLFIVRAVSLRVRPAGIYLQPAGYAMTARGAFPHLVDQHPPLGTLYPTPHTVSI